MKVTGLLARCKDNNLPSDAETTNRVVVDTKRRKLHHVPINMCGSERDRLKISPGLTTPGSS